MKVGADADICSSAISHQGAILSADRASLLV